jgi:hypothetical protein
MARNWTVQFEAPAPSRPATVYATVDVVPTTLMMCDSFDPTTDWFVILPFTVPAEHTGAGTLKIDIWACANTTTAADDARIDVATEFKTPGASEAMNSANIDATPDSGTMTFSTTAYSLQKLTISLTPAVAPVAGDHGRIQVSRDANNGSSLDDLAVALLVVAYEVYEEV